MGKDRVESGRGRGVGPKSPPPTRNRGSGPKGGTVARSAGKRSKTGFYVVLGAVAVLAVVLITMQALQSGPKAITIDPNTPLPKAEGYVLGNPAAPVQVLEFADFECPICSQFATVTEPDIRKRLVEPGKISLRFLDFPLTGVHRNTWEASLTAACANEQGKFWDMHDQLFNTQDQWNGLATTRPKSVFKGLAAAIGLDVGKWESCYDSQKYKLQIAANEKEGERRLVSATPTFVIGSKQIASILGFDAFKAYVDSALASSPEKPVLGGDTAAAKPLSAPAKSKGN